jgi:hypothetical protein
MLGAWTKIAAQALERVVRLSTRFAAEPAVARAFCANEDIHGEPSGAALYFAGIRSRAVRATVLGGLSLALLLFAGASSDAVTASEALRGHVGAQPDRLAIWLAAGLVAVGAAIPGRLRR